MSERIPVKIERLNGGEPILAPQGNGWESEGTCNPGAVYLPRTKENESLIENLLGKGASRDPRTAEGIVAVIYTGCGCRTPGVYASSCGLAIFTPRLELIKRFPDPILYSSGDPKDVDGAGMGDGRLSRIGDTFYLLYSSWNGSEAYACLAYSKNLIDWTRQPKMPGNINVYQNKDHILFEQVIDGWNYCLHRPWSTPFEQKDYAIRLARSRSPLGPWQDCGMIMRSFQHPKRAITWVGGGSAPLPLGGNRFLMIYHTGMIFEDGWREYDGSAAILDFNKFSLDRPDDIVQARLESFFVPETRAEKNPKERLRIDIVFNSGTYVFGEHIYMVYGAGDMYGCGARVNKKELVEAVERSGLESPWKDTPAKA